MSEYTGDGQSNKLSDHRDKLYTRWGALKSERASWVAHWKEISDYLLPRSGRFFIQDRDKGYRRHNNIYDSTGTRALRVLAAGMMAGMTSPARPWFRLGIADKDLMKNHAVKVWLNEVTRLMLEVFSKGNTYRALHHMYEELGAFGTSASVVMDDYNDVIRHYPLTTGEFAIATDYRGQVNTLYREFQKTVAEVVGEFGINNVSSTVKNMHDRGSLDQWVTIVHAIEPRMSLKKTIRTCRIRHATLNSMVKRTSTYVSQALKSSQHCAHDGQLVVVTSTVIVRAWKHSGILNSSSMSSCVKHKVLITRLSHHYKYQPR